jgi:hypothetical protein
MRTFNGVLLTLLLAGCGGGNADAPAIANGGVDPSAAAGNRLPCAGTPDAALAADCTVEEIASNDGSILTLRQPDGGFHRLLVTRDGRGVIAADGAEVAKVTVVDANTIDVAIGGARYRLPATIGPVARP